MKLLQYQFIMGQTEKNTQFRKIDILRNKGELLKKIIKGAII